MPLFKKPLIKYQSNNRYNANNPTYHQESSNSNRAGVETLSASVNIDDFIDVYDGISCKSNGNHSVSQSYLSLCEPNDDETSFYSALQDGFSLDAEDGAYDITQKTNRNAYNPGSFWARELREGDRMPPRSHFQANWYDVNYSIKPAISLSGVWGDLTKKVNDIIRSAKFMFTYGRAESLGFGTSEPQNDTRGPITILRSVSGSFRSGELTGIMGPSGAGKTSLLNFLSRRREDGFTGQYYLDNAQHRIKINSIPQDDRLPEYLTVRENLSFASRLKNTHPRHDHESTIERVSDALGLTDCLDTRTKNISGGQLKRLSIAQELLSRPDILILDEPSSGLDSATCFKTLSVLKNLVKAQTIDPIAVVLTIHQPQHEVFDLFDKIYVMATGGIAIYDGPPNKCIEYVQQVVGISPPNADYNPASFLVEIASGEYGQEPINALSDQVRVAFEAKREKLGANPIPTKSPGSNIFKGMNGGCTDKSASPSSVTRGRSAPYIDHRLAKASSMNKGSFWTKTGVLVRRCWKSILRDPKQLIARIIFHVLTPVFIATLMGPEPGRANACPRYISEIQLRDLVKGNELTNGEKNEEFLLILENVGTYYIIMYSILSANVAGTTLAFTLDIQTSLKEYHNGWYTMPSYLLAQLLANMPMDFCLPTLAVTIGFIATNQNTGNNVNKMPDSYRVLLTAVTISLGSMISNVIAMIVGTFYIGHVTTALFFSQGIMMPFSLLSGIVTRVKDMSAPVAMISRFSYFRHALELAFLLRWGWNVCDCDPKMITGTSVKVGGVSEELRSFVRYWMSSGLSGGDNADDRGSSSNETSAISHKGEDSEDLDLFEVVARQVSQFNAYGVEIKSCDDVKPFQLREFSTSEENLVPKLLILVGNWVVLLILLMLSVKLVIHFRTSL